METGGQPGDSDPGRRGQLVGKGWYQWKGVEWSDSGSTLKVEPARFADGLNVRFERKRGFKDCFPVFWHEMEMLVEEALGKK